MSKYCAKILEIDRRKIGKIWLKNAKRHNKILEASKHAILLSRYPRLVAIIKLFINILVRIIQSVRIPLIVIFNIFNYTLVKWLPTTELTTPSIPSSQNTNFMCKKWKLPRDSRKLMMDATELSCSVLGQCKFTI